MAAYTIIRFFIIVGIAFASISRAGTGILSTHDIHRFPNGTWLENLTIRRTGEILVTLLNTPELVQIDPFRPDVPPVHIATIPGVTGLLGIVEMPSDVYYFIAGNYSIQMERTINGSYSIWKIDMRESVIRDASIHPPPIVTKVTDLPSAIFLDGMAVLNESKDLVIVGDAGKGVVLTVNVKTGASSITIDEPTMNPAGPLEVGINGLKVRGDYLYYTTSGQGLFSRILINKDDGTSAGPAEIIAENLQFPDDMDFDRSGNAYICENAFSVVSKVTPDGVVTVAAGSDKSTAVSGATSARFGRTSKDSHVLYVTTSGGIGANSTVDGGKVVAIYT
jgi:hypothetical protein